MGVNKDLQHQSHGSKQRSTTPITINMELK